ncbi:MULTISPECIES: CinA family protein [Thalassospira]|jgi:nicotinamide-nucleotide amidase|uniref:Damage-inducible protein CinA n=1 Tax=Thalassospira xiamenensis TaxID=220697 RepID=A0ABR5Y3F6_9PROT|nr:MULTISPECIES: CinA family protein [Thalassospira]MBL4841264.1 CinA family protein [Thalassospira sp.]MBR9781935.1 CinA family protein [Rhodospirillales bacterium]KZD05060.1 damage-inducible protein CinA [Thalassospira xiamenensis]KZD11754.1 damage-inducible protein CinA [Thalassospira xiamenensis]MBR9815774.1 CinA family protein [Rhodospirillales bacterium]|tara:strand:- start:1719 stop:2222 length:504 start_codon:yes stop_codon:yes gene_type:complete
MNIEPDILARAENLIALCKSKGEMIATAESCTGGLIAGGLTAVDGSSSVVDCGFVTYSNEAKHGLIGVPQELLDTYGAVSEPVARAMAEGALIRAPLATLAVAVTGIAGPGGGSDEKPVGLVHLACAGKGRPTLHRRRVYDGDRHAVRKATIIDAYEMLSEMVGKTG